MPLLPARPAQVPWVTFVTVAVCAGLLTSFVLFNFGGSLNPGGSQLQVQAQHNISSKLEGLMRISSETLAVVQKASAEMDESAKKQVEELQRDLEAAKQRAAELEAKAAGLEKERDTLQAERKEGPELPERSIPRIFHHMYLGESGPPEKHKAWIESCKLQYKPEAGWQYKMWNTEDVVALIEKHEPAYMKIWNKFPKHVMKIDAGKYMIMKWVGGLYVDTDTECFREGGDMLDGYDLVVQEDYPGAAVNSGVLASKPQHPVWDKAFEIMEERKDHNPDDTGHSTGPQIVRDMILRWHNHTLGASGLMPPTLEKGGSVTRVYPFGWWFTPCGFSSRECHVSFMLKRAAGQVNLTEMVGFHRFTALWLGWKDGLHPQGEDTIKEAFCSSKSQ